MLVISLFIYFDLLSTMKAAPCMDRQQCATCESNGLCISQCYNGYYGLKCHQQCSIGCTNHTCYLEDGRDRCTHGCKLGLNDPTCNIHCKVKTTCRKCPQECEGGFCQLGSSCAQGCQDSYYGTACKSCPAGCEVCNRISGTCEVCLHCEGDCSQGCTEGCIPGYFGKFCEHICSSKCLSGCDKTSGECFKCNPGLFGATCDNQCPSRCLDNECDIDGICTHGCTESWHGSRCECRPSCAGGRCDRDGKCKEGCTPGYFGDFCEHTCSSKCLSGCDKTSGECFKCKPGLFGATCDNQCPRRCLDNECDIDGICTHGCTESWHGSRCECRPSCAGGRCDRDGKCKEGCTPGYFGDFCEHPCSSGCLSSCGQTSGDCVECKSGWFGGTCNKHCPKTCLGGVCYIDGTCTHGGTTAEAPQYWIAGFFLLFIIFLAVVVYVTYHFKRIQNNLNKVNWEASARIRDAEQEDARSFNTVPSINLQSGQDMSQVGVQVVVLKHDDTSSGSLVSVEDEIVDKRVPVQVVVLKHDDTSSGSLVSVEDEIVNKRVPDRELLRKGIVEDDVPSGSDTVKMLGGAEKKSWSKEICKAACDLKNDTNIFVEECDDVIAYRNMKEDGERIVSSNGAMFSGGEDKMKIFKEDDQQDRVQSIKDTQHDCDDREELTSTDIMIGSYDAEEDNDDHDLDITDNQSIEYDENGTTMEATKGRQPESAGAVNTVQQFALDVPDNLSMTYDGDGTTMEAAKGRQPESAGAVNTVQQFAEAQVEETFKVPTYPESQTDIVKFNEQDGEKHYVEVFLMKNK